MYKQHAVIRLTFLRWAVLVSSLFSTLELIRNAAAVGGQRRPRYAPGCAPGIRLTFRHRPAAHISHPIPLVPTVQVIGTLLHNSFNLNPAIMSVVEVKMADVTRHGGRTGGVGSEDGYSLPGGYRPPTRGGDSDWKVATTATMARVPSEAPMTARSQVPRAFGRPDVDGILAALDWLGC